MWRSLRTSRRWSMRSVRASSPVAAARLMRVTRENPAAPLAPAGRRTLRERGLRAGIFNRHRTRRRPEGPMHEFIRIGAGICGTSVIAAEGAWAPVGSLVAGRRSGGHRVSRKCRRAGTEGRRSTNPTRGSSDLPRRDVTLYVY